MNVFTWAIMLAIITAPIATNYILHKYLKKNLILSARTVIIPIICGLIYPVSRYLPEPHITDESVTLIQHFVGGGFVSALYFVYFIREFSLRLPLFIYLLLLYPFVSMMGVTNELLEFTATKLGFYQLDSSDVWWDLLANTLGAYFLLSMLYVLHKLFGKKLAS